MITFPNAKINVGLNITRKRADGYHELETLFLPIGIKDALEIVENGTQKTNFTASGLVVDIPDNENIVMKAHKLLANEYLLPGVDIHLHKAIPFGAGLGGGSADAAFMLKMLNDFFSLDISNEILKIMASKIGADCPFFIDNVTAFATGIGDKLEPYGINLLGMQLLLVKPPINVGTREAYSKVTPAAPQNDLKSVLKSDICNWQGNVKNDFEPSVFELYPEIAQLKQTLVAGGAIYASMSGSGSAVFGIFDSAHPLAFDFPKGYYVWKEVI